MTLHVSETALYLSRRIRITEGLPDYEQQRKDLMHKYGIDLEDGEVSGRGTRKMTRTQVTKLMGSPEEGETDSNGNRVFTWRDQNRRKVRLIMQGCS